MSLNASALIYPFCEPLTNDNALTASTDLSKYLLLTWDLKNLSDLILFFKCFLISTNVSGMKFASI